MKPPLPDKLVHSLLIEMASGNYRPGTRFLSFRQIMRQWKVSDKTVRKSVNYLIENKLLRSSDRSGYYLSLNFRELALLELKQLDDLTGLALPSRSNWQTRVTQFVHNNKALRRIAVIIVVPEAQCAKGDPQNILPSTVDTTARTVRKIASEAEIKGVETLFFASNGSSEKDLEVVHHIFKSNVQGAIIVRRIYSRGIAPMAESLLSKQIPVVTIFGNCEYTRMVSVNFNNFGIGHTAATELFRRGHRKVAVLMSENAGDYFNERLQGCEAALDDYPDSEIEAIYIDPNASVSSLDIKNLLRIGASAVFASSENLFTQMVPHLGKVDIHIPGDLSVILCSSIPVGKNAPNHPFNYLNLDFDELGSRAFKALCAFYSGEIPHKSILINPNLEDQGSVSEASEK